ncbi:hypothetical protein [Marinoscillum furvescens]|uniref:Uncharacterized protein n=1 Tax=Marinoscillum furvescens DSM 4134 TaxID=1122208 RepID=A0A3D9L7U1_MARFU|nr:hypothetical protein [Marinoscillum furvescens]REE01729.1 hypothetical protein C7460_103246 [Marinoscillum furvescens DSM 4134]
MYQGSSPKISCPHCQTPIVVSLDVLFGAAQALCNGCGSTLKVNQEKNREPLQLLEEFMTEVNKIKGIN